MKLNELYLLHNLVISDIKKRYQGSVLGIFWALVSPLIMLGVYTIIFSEIFSVKWSTGSDNKFEFAMMLFSGLCIYNMFSTVIGRSVGIIEQNQNFVKKVVFPIHLLPIMVTLSALFDCIISIFVLLIMKFAISNELTAYILQILIIMMPHIVFCTGIAFIFSSISVYLKDVISFVPILITLMMYASPIFFPLELIPEQYQFIIKLNPMTYCIENMRLAIVNEKVLNIDYLLLSVIYSVIVFFFGYWLFSKAKKGFADLL